MSEDLINRYNKSFRVAFQNEALETKYRDAGQAPERGRGSLAFIVLFLLCSVFAYLEHRAFGHDIALPMYGYLLAALLALANFTLCRLSLAKHLLQIRLLANGVIAMGTVVGAVYLQKYSAYHAIEFSLLAIWLGSLRHLRVILSFALNAVLLVAFVTVMYLTDISSFWLLLVSILLLSAILLGAYIGYVAERAQRKQFLLSDLNASISSRQETWAYTLVDLDMALSGVLDFKELIDLLKKHLEVVIDFDSYVLTSLEGQGPKPVADKIGGELFENEDRTLWTEELLGKLTQTRQAVVSDEHEIVSGFLGVKKKRFTSYRLDVPVFNDSKLLGIISLRRESEPFDNLDMLSSVSLASQAMLIHKRSTRLNNQSSEPAPRDSVITPKGDPDITASSVTRISASENKDMEMTDHSFIESDQTLVPKDVVSEFKKKEASVKKTITLMSRDNADKIAVDRYRTAAVEGEPLSVLIIEVDGLSKLREQDGDEVAYKVFAAIVKYVFSKVDKQKDILGRYGQNGLSVLMPRVDMNAAERFAEMLREFVAKARYRTAYGEKTATLSIGVAAITDDTGDYASMVKRADMALFVAKKNGRNCVKVRL